MEVPLDLRAEAGSVQMTLQQVSRLKPGDVLPFDGMRGGKILLRVEGSAQVHRRGGCLGVPGRGSDRFGVDLDGRRRDSCRRIG